jgi:hypothetical protein
VHEPIIPKPEAGYRKKWYHTGRKESYEKIIIKKEDTTNQNVK